MGGEPSGGTASLPQPVALAGQSLPLRGTNFPAGRYRVLLPGRGFDLPYDLGEVSPDSEGTFWLDVVVPDVWDPDPESGAKGNCHSFMFHPLDGRPERPSVPVYLIGNARRPDRCDQLPASHRQVERIDDVSAAPSQDRSLTLTWSGTPGASSVRASLRPRYGDPWDTEPVVAPVERTQDGRYTARFALPERTDWRGLCVRVRLFPVAFGDVPTLSESAQFEYP